ncbi:MAG: adenylyltransferase/cytidyltransferase family protein [Patescibacteria group bacterium]
MLKKNRQTRIMVFGTFDGLHRGHLNFLKQAKKLTPKSFLVVSVSRDQNVIKIKKAPASLNEKKRKILVQKCKLVDRVVLSGIKDHIPHIIKEKPDIIALGYDQKAYVRNLKKDLKNKGLFVKIVRLKPFRKKIYKSHLLKIKR